MIAAYILQCAAEARMHRADATRKAHFASVGRSLAAAWRGERS
jgi:hypothetical protein